jgi:putative SOS response-associated peptidase YedK
VAIANVARTGSNIFTGADPRWAKDPAIGSKMINARAGPGGEAAFRAAYKRRRCLILADGFYEWRKESVGKTPMYIHMQSGQPFAFAGLWEVWHSPDGSEIPSCTIITTEPNSLMASIHNRMPVILPRDRYAEWLDPAERPADALQGLLRPYRPDEMEAYPVSTLVNNPRHDAPECIERVA